MWHGSPDYEDGLENYFDLHQSSALAQPSSRDGMEPTVLYCDLNATPKGLSQPIGSFPNKAALTIYSHLITSPNCKRRWLGSSAGQLSGFDHYLIHIMLRLHIALQFGKFTLIAVTGLLVCGMLIYKVQPETGHSENLHPNEQYSELRCVPCR